MITPELLADYACACGENPLWHPFEKKIYWLDIVQPRMFRYDPATGQHEQFYAGRTIGGFTFQTDGSMLAFMDRGTIAVMRDGKIERVVVDEIPAERESRFNDVFADTRGRVFCGTMPGPNGPGSLYRLDLDGSLTKVVENVLCSNGMGFTPDRKHLYYTDSERYTIYLYDYDEETGSLTNRRVFVEHAPELGLPDGMTVDADGFVWSAHWDGNALYRYDSSGREVMKIAFPVRKVSSVIFGGDDLCDMYVTTAGGDQKATDGEHAGALYRLRIPGVRGTPEFLSHVGI